MNKKDLLIEVCCGSSDDAYEAMLGGADRIELNSGVFLGGLTPTIGTLIETKKRVDLPVIAMIRPRVGGFDYSESEFNAMLTDTKLAVENGADGIVFGILDSEGEIDIDRCRQIIEVVDGKVEVVFHRAFDVTKDPIKALDTLIEIGIDRVLTTGQKNNSFEAMPLIKRLVEYGENRIEILAGFTFESLLEEFVERTNVTQIHMAAFKKTRDYSVKNHPDIFFGAGLYPSETVLDLTDSRAVSSMRNNLK